MKCRSGKHEWTNEVYAKRCCAKGWKRAMRHISDKEELDGDGRVYMTNEPFVHGWIKEKDYEECLK